MALGGLAPETRSLLRQLATLSLQALGIASPTPQFVEDEMLRQFSRLVPALPREGDRERAMESAIRTALDELES